MSRRAVLWVAFVLVHVVVAALGWMLPNQPMGDVYLVYEPWSRQALNGTGIVGVTEAWVYPGLALVPMVLAHAFTWIAGYTAAWAIFVALCNALAFALLVGRGRSRGRVAGAWFWLGYLLLLGPIGMYRIDAVTVPLAIAGLLFVAGRSRVGAVLLTIGAWIKIWPVALVAAAFVALRRRAVVVVGALAVTAAVLCTDTLAGGGPYVLGFVMEQTGRGLQLEAPVSMFYLWQAVAGVEGSYLYYDPDILTFQVTGPNVDILIAVMTPLLALITLALMGLGAFAASRGARVVALLPPLALALTLTLIAFNKVGSPQFISWLIAPLVFWIVLDRRRAWPLAAAGLGVAALTQAVYPLTYGYLLAAEPLAVALLTARNALLLALWAWAVIRLSRVGVPARTSSPAPSQRSTHVDRLFRRPQRVS